MAEITIGDYIYNTDGSVRAASKTQQTYGPILSEFEYEGTVYTVTTMIECFKDCSSLTQAPDIPSGVTNINRCFYECSLLTQAPEIPSSVTNMGSCFRNCTSLTQAPEIPSSVTKLDSCFSGCSNLTQAPEIPSSVTTLVNCFYGCSSLTQAPEIPSSVTNMGGCFNGCSSLTQAPEIPNSVTSMTYCFGSCSNLTQAPEIPSSVTTLVNCFYGCSSLTQAPEIPSSVTNMRRCFRNCINLTQAPEIPSSVTDMFGCFDGCSSLQGNVVFHNVIESYSNIFNATIQQIFLFNGTNPKDASITTVLRDIASQYSNVIFEFDGLISPSTNLNVIRVDDDNETTSSLTGTWFYLTATTTTYNDGLPDNWYAELNSIVLKADSLDITQDSHIIGPTVISDNKYSTKSWYDTDNLAQHTIDFVTVLQVYNENDEPQVLKEFTFKVIFNSSVPLVHYLFGGSGIAFGGEAEADKFICYLDAQFNKELTAQDMTAQEVQDFIDSLNIHGEDVFRGIDPNRVIDHGTATQITPSKDGVWVVGGPSTSGNPLAIMYARCAGQIVSTSVGSNYSGDYVIICLPVKHGQTYNVEAYRINVNTSLLYY